MTQYPDPTTPPDPTRQRPAPEAPDAEPEPTGHEAPARPSRRFGRPDWTRGRAGLVGGALALALLAGLGGFALGYAVAPDGFDRHRPGHPGRGGFPGPPGAFPGPGRPDDPPAAPDGDPEGSSDSAATGEGAGFRT